MSVRPASVCAFAAGSVEAVAAGLLLDNGLSAGALAAAMVATISFVTALAVGDLSEGRTRRGPY